MKYITLSLAFLIAFTVIGCGSKKYQKKQRTMEHKQNEQNAFKDLNQELKNK